METIQNSTHYNNRQDVDNEINLSDDFCFECNNEFIFDVEQKISDTLKSESEYKKSTNIDRNSLIRKSGSQNSFRSISDENMIGTIDNELSNSRIHCPTPMYIENSWDQKSPLFKEKKYEEPYQIGFENEESKELNCFVKNEGTDRAKAYIGPLSRQETTNFTDHVKDITMPITIDTSVIDSNAIDDVTVYFEFKFNDIGNADYRIANRRTILIKVMNFFKDYTISDNSELGSPLMHVLDDGISKELWCDKDNSQVPKKDIGINSDYKKNINKERAQSEDLSALIPLASTPVSHNSKDSDKDNYDSNRSKSAPTVGGIRWGETQIIPNLQNQNKTPLEEALAAAVAVGHLTMSPSLDGTGRLSVWSSSSGSITDCDSLDDLSSIDTESRPGTPTGREQMEFKSLTEFSTIGTNSNIIGTNYCKENNLVYFKQLKDGSSWEYDIDFLPKCVQIDTENQKFISRCTNAKSSKNSNSSLDILREEIDQLKLASEGAEVAVKQALSIAIENKKEIIQKHLDKKENKNCSKWSKCHRYCLKPPKVLPDGHGCSCKKRHIRPIKDILKKRRTQLCLDSNCNGGSCQKAHSSEEVRKTFVTMCLDKILSTHSSTYPLDWKCFFPKKGHFNTTLDFFSFVHETVVEWTIKNRELIESSHKHVNKTLEPNEDIWKKENFSKNITRWINIAYNDGELNPQCKLWPSDDIDEDHYREDIIRLLGARIETEGCHLIVSGDKKIAFHKSRGCKGDKNKEGNYQPCPYFCNCFKGFHTLRELMKKIPKKSLLPYQKRCDYDCPKNYEATDQITLDVDGNQLPLDFIKKNNKYILVCKASGNVLVKLTKIEKNDSDLSMVYSCTFHLEKSSNIKKFHKDDLLERPEILTFDSLVIDPILTLQKDDFILKHTRLILSTDKCIELERGGRYLLRFFDDKGQFYDEHRTEYVSNKKSGDSGIINFFNFSEGFIPRDYCYVQIFRALNKGSIAEKSTSGTLIPIIEKNFVDLSYVIGCNDEVDKLEIIKSRNDTYQHIMGRIREYNKTLEMWHRSDNFSTKIMTEKWNETIEDFLGNPLFNFKPLQIKNGEDYPLDISNLDLNDKNEFPLLGNESKVKDSEKNTNHWSNNSLSQPEDSVEVIDGLKTPPRNKSKVDFGENTTSPDILSTPPKKDENGKSPRRPKGILKKGEGKMKKSGKILKGGKGKEGSTTSKVAKGKLTGSKKSKNH